MDICWAEEQRWRVYIFINFAPASSAISILLKIKQTFEKSKELAESPGNKGPDPHLSVPSTI